MQPFFEKNAFQKFFLKKFFIKFFFKPHTQTLQCLRSQARADIINIARECKERNYEKLQGYGLELGLALELGLEKELCLTYMLLVASCSV